MPSKSDAQVIAKFVKDKFNESIGDEVLGYMAAATLDFLGGCGTVTAAKAHYDCIKVPPNHYEFFFFYLTLCLILCSKFRPLLKWQNGFTNIKERMPASREDCWMRLGLHRRAEELAQYRMDM